MKKLAALLFAIVGLSAFAGTCVVQKVAITTFDGKKTYGAELKNDSGANILNHKFKVAFLDSNGAILETKTVDGCLRSLQNGETDFFSVQSSKSPSSIANVLSRIEGPLTFGDVADGELTLSNIKVTRNGQDLVVTGTIKNTGNVDLENARPCIVVRNDDGNVQVVKVGTDKDLNEDDTFNFTVNVNVKDDTNDSDKVDVWADATNPDDDDKPIAPTSDEDNNIDECDATPTSTPTGSPTPTATNTPGAGTPTVTPTNTPVSTAC